jgi:hypothetical protein
MDHTRYIGLWEKTHTSSKITKKWKFLINRQKLPSTIKLVRREPDSAKYNAETHTAPRPEKEVEFIWKHVILMVLQLIKGSQSPGSFIAYIVPNGTDRTGPRA